MPAQIHNKLVRDKIPEIIKMGGNTPIYRVLDPLDRKEALFSKLVEEIEELRASRNRRDILRELADVQEVFNALCREYKVCGRELQWFQDRKREERGGFEKGYFLETTEEGRQ